MKILKVIKSIFMNLILNIKDIKVFIFVILSLYKNQKKAFGTQVTNQVSVNNLLQQEMIQNNKPKGTIHFHKWTYYYVINTVKEFDADKTGKLHIH